MVPKNGFIEHEFNCLLGNVTLRRALFNGNFYRAINLSLAIQRIVKAVDLRENRETRGRRNVNRGKSRVKC